MISNGLLSKNFLVRLSLTAAFSTHFVVAACYWWLSPKGFPLAHSRFWLNAVLPLVVMCVALCGLAGLRHNRQQLTALIAVMFASCWLGGAAASRILFPLSLRGFWQLGLVIAICGFGLAWILMRGQHRTTWQPALSALLSILAGAFSVWAQVSPPSSTRPRDISIPVLNAAQSNDESPAIKLGANVRFDTSSATLMLRRDEVAIHCFPTLRFDRVSPDKFWSILAPRPINIRKLLATTITDASEQFFEFNGNNIVKLSKAGRDESVECTAWTKLEQDTYSHLNSYCILIIEGHQNLSLGFSPCPDKKIEVQPADYPTGRPARFAYLTPQQEFKVVEGSSGEKGPFQTLASGQLARGDPLSISFHENNKILATLTLEDWTQQLSTELSPSAGWGVPQNAIEFRRTGDHESSPAEIFITLAATSVGRGWETVGHRAGMYRNQMSFKIEP